MNLRSYEQIKPFAGKRILVRCNFDVSVESGKVDEYSTWRIDASLPLLKELSDSGARTVVISHRGRPEGEDSEFSLSPIVDYIKTKGLPVSLGEQIPNEGEIVVRENVRFSSRESNNDDTFAKELALVGEVFINDDFATAHRAHSSTVGVTNLMPSYAGPLLLREVAELSRAREAEGEGLVVIIGGAKAETKNKLVTYFIEKGATVLSGGITANSILQKRGKPTGKSLVDDTQIPETIIQSSKLIAPTDVVVSSSLDSAQNVASKDVLNVSDSDFILDIGPQTERTYSEAIKGAKYIIWNGPLGLVEMPEFTSGSKVVGRACVESEAYTLCGGGDIVTFVSKEGLRDKFNYVSTGGGAMLSFLAGETLPALEALKE